MVTLAICDRLVSHLYSSGTAPLGSPPCFGFVVLVYPLTAANPLVCQDPADQTVTSFPLAGIWALTSVAAIAKYCPGPIASNRIRSMAEEESAETMSWRPPP